MCCEISSNKIISKFKNENRIYFIPFNISGFAHCGENLLLALEIREFVYEFNSKIKEPSSNCNLINFLVKD